MLPHAFAIQSVRLYLLAGRSFLDIGKGPGLSWWQRGTVRGHTCFCSSQSPRHTSGFQTPMIYRSWACRLGQDAQQHTGKRRHGGSPLLPPPSVCPTDSNLLPSNAFLTMQPPNLKKPTKKCNSAHLNAEAAAANANRCSIATPAVSSVTDANTGPHPARC